MPPASVRNNDGGTRVPKKESVSSTSRMAEVRWPTESRGVSRSEQADRESKPTRITGPSTSNEQNQDGSPDSASDQPSMIKKGVLFDDLKLIPTDRRIDPPFWVCFNCWRKGHIAKNCNLPPRHSYCHNCGRVNVKVDDCPRCSEAYFRSSPHRQSAAARLGGQAPRVAQTPSSPIETVSRATSDEFESRGRRTPDSQQTTLVNESLRGKKEPQQQPRATTARASSTVAAETIEMSKEEEKRRQMEKFRQRKEEERRRELEETEKKKEEECRYEVEQAELAEQRRRDMELRRERLELFTREQRRRVRRNISADDLKEYIKNLRSLQLPQDLRQDALEAFLYE